MEFEQKFIVMQVIGTRSEAFHLISPNYFDTKDLAVAAITKFGKGYVSTGNEIVLWIRETFVGI